MRFNKRNWIKYFDGSNKQTTIRLRKSKMGHHKAYAGSYYNPIVLGEFDIVVIQSFFYKDLNKEHAKLDGFNTLEELKKELLLLNGKIMSDTKLYQHWTDNVKCHSTTQKS